MWTRCRGKNGTTKKKTKNSQWRLKDLLFLLPPLLSLLCRPEKGRELWDPKTHWMFCLLVWINANFNDFWVPWFGTIGRFLYLDFKLWVPFLRGALVIGKSSLTRPIAPEWTHIPSSTTNPRKVKSSTLMIHFLGFYCCLYPHLCSSPGPMEEKAWYW